MLPISLMLPKDTCLANRGMELKPTQTDSMEFAMNPSVRLPVPFILLSPHTYDNIHSSIFSLLILWLLLLFYFATHSSSVRHLHAGMLQGSVWRSLLFSFCILSQWDVIIHMVIISYVDLARTQIQLCSLGYNVDCPWAAQPSCAQVNSGDVLLKDLFLLPAPPYQKSPPFTCFLMIEYLKYTCESLDDHSVWPPTLSNVTCVCYHQKCIPDLSSALHLLSRHSSQSPPKILPLPRWNPS